ncbi:magnesium chelatase family protein [Williamsia sterculiae]|uniref:Magnesium chelatase family protein n=1 Tax=Williamsia sterculiae TaxID=1344003 RepID=A0A1N7GI06_9NOCA|nr:magnesium chelatase family protein [Williamsia sterculiae]
MALGRVSSVALHAFDATLVEIEANVGQGLPGVTIVGMADTSTREAKDRVRAAIVNSGFKWPEGRITLSLSPAELRKSGSMFDLALALAVLATDQISSDRLRDTVFVGELGLDGRLRGVRGVLPAVVAARREGKRCAVVPMANVDEATVVGGIEVGAAQNLAEVVGWVRGRRTLDTVDASRTREPVTAPAIPDMGDVVGQEDARYAMEIAAAGAHHLFMTGPPGIGKTMLARRLPGILPTLTDEESLEVTSVHSIAGTLSPKRPLITEPPFVAPHHSTSVTALTGGGTGIARPGAISLAHRGVLFLDDANKT